MPRRAKADDFVPPAHALGKNNAMDYWGRVPPSYKRLTTYMSVEYVTS